jgi:hypothetical protein
MSNFYYIHIDLRLQIWDNGKYFQKIGIMSPKLMKHYNPSKAPKNGLKNKTCVLLDVTK